MSFEPECELDHILLDPSLAPYTKEIDDALGPAVLVLRNLFDYVLGTSPLVPSIIVPAVASLTSHNTKNQIPPITSFGDLSILDRAHIANWFETHIAKDAKQRSLWIMKLPNAHAITVLISYRLSPGRRNKTGHLTAKSLQDAWKYQVEKSPKYEPPDVDQECISRLEMRMFERSKSTGVSGNCQWGLDAGDHQDCWYPYAKVPEWNLEDRDSESESELTVCNMCSFRRFTIHAFFQRGPDYIELPKPPTNKDINPGSIPRPRPTAKNTRTKAG